MFEMRNIMKLKKFYIRSILAVAFIASLFCSDGFRLLEKLSVPAVIILQLLMPVIILNH